MIDEKNHELMRLFCEEHGFDEEGREIVTHSYSLIKFLNEHLVVNVAKLSMKKYTVQHMMQNPQDVNDFMKEFFELIKTVGTLDQSDILTAIQKVSTTGG